MGAHTKFASHAHLTALKDLAAVPGAKNRAVHQAVFPGHKVTLVKG